MNTKSLPLVSVVITTKNEEKNIDNCLESIKSQTYPQKKIEIIVVDNNSTDKTKEIARKHTDRVYNHPEFDKIKNIQNFRGSQLNFGVRKSKGEIIFFPDADMTFDRGLIEEISRLIEKSFNALFIPEKVLGTGLFGKIRDFERSFYNTTCIDAVRAIRKSLFIKSGGFDEKNICFGFDDWDFNKKIKNIESKITSTKNKLYHHEEGLTLKKYLNKKTKYANVATSYIRKWGKNDPDIQKQFGFYYRYFGVFLENGKWKKLLRHPVLAGGMYFLRFMVGVQYLNTKLKK